jgi:hypothetical protein
MMTTSHLKVGIEQLSCTLNKPQMLNNVQLSYHKHFQKYPERFLTQPLFNECHGVVVNTSALYS